MTEKFKKTLKDHAVPVSIGTSVVVTIAIISATWGVATSWKGVVDRLEAVELQCKANTLDIRNQGEEITQSRSDIRDILTRLEAMNGTLDEINQKVTR